MDRERMIEVLKRDRDLASFNPMTGELRPMDELNVESAEALDMAIKLLEQTRWIPVTKDMPEEKDTWFAKFWGTDKWSEFMFRKKSDLVDVTVELEDGTRYTDTSRTHDGKWDVEERHGAIKKKVVAWHYMSEPWEGEAE